MTSSVLHGTGNPPRPPFSERGGYVIDRDNTDWRHLQLKGPAPTRLSIVGLAVPIRHSIESWDTGAVRFWAATYGVQSSRTGMAPDGDAGLGRWIPAKGRMTGAGVAEILRFKCDCSVARLIFDPNIVMLVVAY